MPQPFLHLGNIRIVIERIGRGGRTKRMGADFQPEPQRIPPHELVDPVRRDGVVESASSIVAHRTEEGTLGVGGVVSLVQVVIEELVGPGVQRQVAGLAAFAMDPEMRNSTPRVNVFGDF